MVPIYVYGLLSFLFCNVFCCEACSFVWKKRFTFLCRIYRDVLSYFCCCKFHLVIVFQTHIFCFCCKFLVETSWRIIRIFILILFQLWKHLVFQLFQILYPSALNMEFTILFWDVLNYQISP